MKKSIFLFFAAILCATSAWAHNLAANQYVYFEKPSDWEAAQLLIGKNDWSEGYTMTKISNTNLYYLKTVKWDGYTEYYFFEKTVKWGGEGNSPTHRTQWTGKTSSKFTSAIAKCHLFNSTKSIKSSTTATDYATVVNRTQTIKVQLKDGSNWVDATVVPADLTASTYALTSSTAAGAKSASLAKESTTVSATVDAAYSATVSLTCENVLDGYVFDGWYDANGNKITSYTVSDAHTVYARFIQSAEETNLVTVSYKCDTKDIAASITEQVGVETEKSYTAPTITGYKFTSWTVGAGMILKAGTVADATITVVTKSASSNYTLVANYEEVLETVYFINAGNWADVHIHLWNGTATGTEWPGTKLTATGTKIGEYDVYEYTAQQGAHANLLFHKKDNDSQKTTDLTWSEGVDKYYIHNHNGNTGWYTQAEAEAILVAPVVEETVYFVNNKNWTKVQVHAWKDAANNGWPGEALTATGDTVAGFAVYSFTAPQGTYTNLLFNNKEGDAGVQSNNFVWTDGKYYYMGAAADYAGGTKEDITTAVAPDPLATDVYLAGEMNSWNTTANEFKKATAEATTASVTVNLTAQTYKFKLIIGEGNWRGNTGTMKRGGDAVHEGGWSFEEEGGDDKNCKIVADIAGDYTFTWDLTNKKLTVTYPELPTYNVTATVNPAETGTIEGAGTYVQGATATLTATAAEGYEFVNWTVAGEEVSTEATYSFTVTADVEVVANFKEAEPEYNVVEDEITNLNIDTESMCIIGGPSAEFGVDVFLALTEQNQDGTWALSDESSVAIQGIDATFIDGYAYDIDLYAPAVKVVLRVEFGGSNYELHIDMVSKPVVIEIADAIVSKEEYPDGMGGTYTNWTMDGQWSDGETTYPVLVNMPDFDPTIVEADMTVTITIGSWVEVMYGAAEGSVHATVAENVVTLTGTLTSYAAGTWEVTISGTLPAVPSALDNLNTTVAPVKAIENGQLIIVKNGVKYNAQGAILK